MRTSFSAPRFSFIAILSALVATGCISKTSPVAEVKEREPAAVPPLLVYMTYEKDGKMKREEISPERWKGQNSGFSSGGREDYLIKFYSANTRGVSLRNIRHATCFRGSADEVKNAFFTKNDPQVEVRNLQGSHPEVKASSDGKMLGIAFTHTKKGFLHFRMTSCEFGKSDFAEDISNRVGFVPRIQRSVASTSARNQDGFGIEDQMPAGATRLPRFELRADFDKGFTTSEDRPWEGMDLTNKVEQIKFALILQKYFYENMANQNPSQPDMNFIAQKNKARYWCHMPWMQTGVNGREAVHGLTKEMDLRPSKNIPTYMNATPGSDWGVAYFNGPGCRTLGNVFGSKSQPLDAPRFQNSDFDHGTVSAKILFTTADFPEIKDAYQWKANVSEPGMPERGLKTVRHIQMDISIKDMTLKGTNALLKNWVMLGYYYDPNYDYDKDIKPIVGMENPLNSIPNLPKALYKMRPMGIQLGLDKPETGDTVVFPGAYANGSGGRLNGPADNPRSSCLGCHGAAGTGASMIPGFLSMKMLEPYKENLTLDFNQQLALAKDNYETAP